MKKKIILTILILIFLIINLYTSFLTFLDYIAEYKTIRIENQNEYIQRKSKNILILIMILKKLHSGVGFQMGII